MAFLLVDCSDFFAFRDTGAEEPEFQFRDLGHPGICQGQPEPEEVLGEVAVHAAVAVIKTGLFVVCFQKVEKVLAILVNKRLLANEHVALDERGAVQVVGKPGAEVLLGLFEYREEYVEPLHVLCIGEPHERRVVLPVEELGDDDVRLVQHGVGLGLGDAGPSVIVGVREEPAVVFEADDIRGRMLPHVIQGGKLTVPWVQDVDIVSLVENVYKEFFPALVEFKEIVVFGSYYIYAHGGKLS